MCRIKKKTNFIYRGVRQDEDIPFDTDELLPKKSVGRVVFSLGVHFLLSTRFYPVYKKYKNKSLQEDEDQEMTEYSWEDCLRVLQMIKNKRTVAALWNTSIEDIAKRFKPFTRMIKEISNLIKDLVPSNVCIVLSL